MSAATASDLSPPMNHVFLDYENVHHVDRSLIGQKRVSFTILTGAHQKLDVAVVEKLMQHPDSVQLIRLTTAGKNALDFTLVYYLGRAVLADPKGYFHIVSKDKGYDALIEHLKSRHVRACRHSDYKALTFSGPPKATPVVFEDSFTRAVENLRKSSTKRPTKKKKLLNHLKSNLGKETTDKNVTELLEELCMAGHLSFDDKDAVIYHFKD